MKKLGLAIIGATFLTFAAVSEVEVIKGEVSLKKEQGAKQEVYTAQIGERLFVVAEKGSWAQVRASSGIVGWVKKADVKPVTGAAKPGQEKFHMDEAKVLGFLENPQAVYILDNADPNFRPINLDRSFANNLGGNIDKETNQRIYDPALKPEK